jgi:hypothetical protein
MFAIHTAGNAGALITGAPFLDVAFKPRLQLFRWPARSRDAA